MAYDRERLMDDADSYTVATYIGMDVIKRGANYWIHCPGHEKRLGKPDNRIGNCCLTKKGYKCFACGVSKNIFDMVMEYYESELGQDISFTESMGIVGDALGGRELYILDGDKKNKTAYAKAEKKDKLRTEDYELLGLPYSMEYEQLVGCGKNKENLNGTIKKIGDIYEYYEGKRIPWTYIQSQAPDTYKQIIIRHAEQKKKKYQNVLRQYCNRDGLEIDFMRIFSKNHEIDDELLFDVKEYVQDCIEKIEEIIRKIDPEHQEAEETIDYFALFG